MTINHNPHPHRYMPVIGLEVHVELKTKSKMFCGCPADYFGKEPNTHTCPVCLGLPGALPVPNKTAINWCIMIGLALNCKVNKLSKFDRKNYFYPDLAKGYQISQYDQPFSENGFMILNSGKKIGIRRVHMEEDTAKLTHRNIDQNPNLKAQNEENVSLIDFNRSGVPLVEIVTEPDFANATDVKEYLQKLQQIVRYLGVSDADMEKGNMRLEPNISLRESNKPINELPDYKVEVKNINSFRFVEKAINYELNRQQILLDKGEKPTQETRGWNETKQITFSQRSKEEAHDYRYFPEPDIPPIITVDAEIIKIKKHMPELPQAKLDRFIKTYALPSYDAGLLTREKQTADYFEQAVTAGKKLNVSPKKIANEMINKKTDISRITPSDLVKAIASASQTIHLSTDKIQAVIEEVLTGNQKAVEDYKKGKENVLMFLLGQVLKKLAVKADTQLIKELLIKSL